MDLIAHRGFASEAPENTVAAMTHAVAAGADAVEFDVRRCGSGEPVVVHDATVDRVTGSSGRVSELPADDLAALDVLGSGEGIPTLSAVVEAVPAEVAINAELKEPVVDDALPALESAPNEVLVSSFEESILADVEASFPGVPTALLCVEGEEDPVGRAASLGCAAIHPGLHLALSEGFVARAQGVGLRVNAWTVEYRETADQLRDAGVDGLVADRSDVI